MIDCAQGGFYQAWPEGFLLSSTTSLSARKERENQWCSVKSPLLINEYFLSREEKERQIERKERETAPMGQICMHGLVAALCRSMEIYQREQERERWSRRKRGKQRVVHRQEISPGKLIPKHKSHRPPLLFPPKSGPGLSFHHSLHCTLNFKTIFEGKKLHKS